VLDPGDANLNKPPPELEDPAQRAQWAADERAAREEARAPYVADRTPVVERTRFSTTGRTQLEEVTERLKAFDPARVYGVYRVPDRYDLKQHNENRARVDWEIVHAPEASGSSEIHTAAFDRAGHWAQRRFGEPSVLDEDVAGALVARARLEPEDCFGLPRLLQIRARESEEGKLWHAHVEGILAFAGKPLAAAHEALQTEAPLPIGAPPCHVEILDWESVAAWVAPSRHTPARTPSPLPHLPSRWEELMTATWRSSASAARTATASRRRAPTPRTGCPTSRSRASARTSAGEHELIHAAELVVIAYRDRAEYQEGRERWRAYQDEVLRARLDQRSGRRPPLDTEYRPPPSFLSEVFDMFNPLDPMHALPQILGRKDRPQLGPVLRARLASGVLLRLPDPDGLYSAVRLTSDLPAQDFARHNGEWRLEFDRADVERLEYQLEVEHDDGATEYVLDPGNPNTAPGAFGDKSVLLLPAYAPPAWLDAPHVEGEKTKLAVRRMDAQVWSPAGADPEEPLPLLVAHDGPEYDKLSQLTRFSAVKIAAGELPPHRVALLAPRERDEWYSASPRYTRMLMQEVLPKLPPTHGAPAAIGASLGALGLLYAHRRHPRHVRRALPPVRQLLHPALRRARVALPALPPRRRLRGARRCARPSPPRCPRC
jgi:hypothetical protein